MIGLGLRLLDRHSLRNTFILKPQARLFSVAPHVENVTQADIQCVQCANVTQSQLSHMSTFYRHSKTAV